MKCLGKEVVVLEILFEDNRVEYIGEYTKQYNLKNYSKGVYYLEIVTDKGVINKKLVLN